MTEPARPRRRLDLSRVLGWFGLVAHLAIGVFPFAPSGVVLAGAPFVFVWLVWLAGLAAVVVLRRRAPRLTPLVPVASVVAWLATVAAFGSA